MCEVLTDIIFILLYREYKIDECNASMMLVYHWHLVFQTTVLVRRQSKTIFKIRLPGNLELSNRENGKGERRARPKAG